MIFLKVLMFILYQQRRMYITMDFFFIYWVMMRRQRGTIKNVRQVFGNGMEIVNSVLNELFCIFMLF